LNLPIEAVPKLQFWNKLNQLYINVFSAKIKRPKRGNAREPAGIENRGEPQKMQEKAPNP
jgi:hypothetical protein